MAAAVIPVRRKSACLGIGKMAYFYTVTGISQMPVTSMFDVARSPDRRLADRRSPHLR